MPELPDTIAQVEALRREPVSRRIAGAPIINAFIVRSFEPAVETIVGRCVNSVDRIGKR